MKAWPIRGIILSGTVLPFPFCAITTPYYAIYPLLIVAIKPLQAVILPPPAGSLDPRRRDAGRGTCHIEEEGAFGGYTGATRIGIVGYVDNNLVILEF